jgi:hypothetical protein
MRLSIIVEDNAVYKDNYVYSGLDLSSCSIPANVWALQWYGSAGELEYNSREENTPITEIPDWANACLVKWQEAEDARIAAESEVTPE